MAQVGTGKQVGTRVEVMCSQLEVIGPVVEVDSVPVVVGPVVKVVALIGVEAMEVLSLVVQAVTVNVSAVEVMGPACELAIPWLKAVSVDEVKCSVVIFFASVIHVGPGGLVSEVTVSVRGSIGPVVKVGPSVTDPVVVDSVL